MRELHCSQAIPIQPAMQNMQQMVPPYSMELYNTASAAGYWAERLGADEQQRSYLVMQQVPILPLHVRLGLILTKMCAVSRSAHDLYCYSADSYAGRLLDEHPLHIVLFILCWLRMA